MLSLLFLSFLIDFLDNFSLNQDNGNVAKETVAEPLGEKDVNAWKDGSVVEVSFATEHNHAIITLSEKSN